MVLNKNSSSLISGMKKVQTVTNEIDDLKLTRATNLTHLKGYKKSLAESILKANML